ncbi:MAG: SMEK domain-containing protein [Eubacteriaceae bacterium]|nr:SMEK domain-containing protein [Eubacteriaceae bacterium]
MKYSAERMQYITEYMISYKSKIENLNKNGLFDAAKLFELFAEKICKLWFGQQFKNLNDTTANFPYVDLISDDGQLYIQVSTTQNISKKIRGTLEKIRDNKSNSNYDIKKLFFIMLADSNGTNIKDYSGSNKIGNIDFVVQDNLISANNIIKRAKDDLEFQIELYELLYKESNSYSQTETKLHDAVFFSRELLETNIDDLINGEYEIDRQNLIDKIHNDHNRYISIQGDAGSGKSALCKKLLHNEQILLFARAEKFVGAKAIDDIWGFDIDVALRYLNGMKIVFYIDALEFIADGLKVKLDLLQQLYRIADKYSNVCIVTSCRTCDRTAFIKIEEIYRIKKYNVDFLNNDQIIKVAQKYKVIQDLWEKKAYMQLLRSPFYINLLVSKIKDVNEISDVNEFRNLIWAEIICMNGRTLPEGIHTSDIRRAVEKIVFKRAEYFLSGVSIEDVGEEIFEVLKSEDIVTICEGNRVRLKYDIFEDICFERLIDRLFDECRGNYIDFYTSFKELGRCMYRRYQIWVENKLLSKSNREKFLLELLRNTDVQKEWSNQTIIGIVKSDFCEAFFDEHKDEMEGYVFTEFLRLTNLFAFETNILRLKSGNVYTHLNPVGKGRECLIRILYKSCIYKDPSIKNHAVKICSDYSQSSCFDKDTAEVACIVLEHYINTSLEEAGQKWHYHLDEEINDYLSSIYKMAEYSKEWIKQFWSDTIFSYLENNHDRSRLDKEILKYVLKNTTPSLAIHFPEELCDIADTYWLKKQKNDKKEFYYSEVSRSKAKEYGLSREADSYSYEFKSATENKFIFILAQYNYKYALKWIIDLTNYVSEYYREQSPNNVFDIQIWIDDPETANHYVCEPDFWIVGTQENRVHELIGDALFAFTKVVVNYINSSSYDNETVTQFADEIKNSIIKESNNIMMLTVISEIGRQSIMRVPGYAIELASSIDLVMLDIQKMAILLPNPERQLIEQQILMAVGIPNLTQRYKMPKKNLYSLQEYMIRMQSIGDEKIKERTEKVLDFLYEGIPNTKENARYNLQIQKMDLRMATINKVDNNYYKIIPEIDGEAKKFVEDNEKNKCNVERNELRQIIEKCCIQANKNELDTNTCIEAINAVNELARKSDIPFKLQQILIMLISYAFTKPDLDRGKRSELCCLWIDGVEKIFNNETFPFDIILSKQLFAQLEKKIDNVTSDRLKRLMIKCILYRGPQGVIFNITSMIKEYLLTNNELAKNIFNTIIAISEDKMESYIYNASQIKKEDDSFEYKPNMQAPPVGIDDEFKREDITLHKNHAGEIINKHLINEECKDYTNWDVKKCDIRTLCYISNCGLNLENAEFNLVMKTMFPYMIKSMSLGDELHNFLDNYAIGEVTSFIERELANSTDVDQIITILFTEIDFSMVSNRVYELYDGVGEYLLAMYFDGSNDALLRKRCKNTIKNLEKRICCVEDDKAKKRLTSMLLLKAG